MGRFLSSRIIEFVSLLFLLLVILLHIGQYAEFSGVATEQAWLTTSDGVQLNARVYQPTSLDTVPGIVVCHGGAGSLQMMQRGFSLEFAKRGFLVVAIDMRGHGDSGGKFSFLNEKDVMAGVDYLFSISNLDQGKVAVLGHSMGGAAVFREGYSDPRVKSIVAIAPALSPYSGMNLTSPRNLLLAVGAKDNIISESIVLMLLNKTTGGGEEVDKLYGNFSEGNARKMIVSPRIGHAGEVIDRYIVEESIAWVEASLDIEPTQSISISPWLNIFLPLSVIASLLSVFPAIICVRELGKLKREVQSPEKTGLMGVGKLVIVYVGAWGGSVLSIYFRSLFGWVPVVFADTLVAYYVTASIILLLATIFFKQTNRKLQLSLLDIKTSVVLGVSGFLVVFSALNVLFSWTFIDLLPTTRELFLMLGLFFVFLPLTVLDVTWLRNIQNKLSIKPWKRTGVTVILYMSEKLLILAFVSFIFRVFLWLTLTFLFIPGLFTAWMLEDKESVIGGAIFNAFFIAWIVAVVFPFGYFPYL
ncbi:alpha/beta fold hydrolase [Candidatus Bathyarchaeota archaeon]|nr:alpha/beta fold hydrolase [Candidatus Bathyarchaeota archaeon]